jgi:hypothetical protein
MGPFVRMRIPVVGKLIDRSSNSKFRRLPSFERRPGDRKKCLNGFFSAHFNAYFRQLTLSVSLPTGG